MYIQETNSHDRLVIHRAADHIFDRLERAHYLLSEVQDSHFSGYEKEPITAQDVEGIAVKLEIVGDILFDALTNYALTVGWGDAPGVTPHLESAERAALAVKVENQLRAVFPGIDRTERRKEIMGLSDKEAITILEKEGAAV